jgi:hypothetical protein
VGLDHSFKQIAHCEHGRSRGRGRPLARGRFNRMRERAVPMEARTSSPNAPTRDSCFVSPSSGRGGSTPVTRLVARTRSIQPQDARPFAPIRRSKLLHRGFSELPYPFLLLLLLLLLATRFKGATGSSTVMSTTTPTSNPQVRDLTFTTTGTITLHRGKR